MSDLAEAWAACPQISGVHASADGAWAFWAWSGWDEVDQIWAVPTDGSAPPRCLTAAADHLAIRDVSADGRFLVLATSRNACEHDRLLALDRVSGALRDLTPEQATHYALGGVFTGDGAVIWVADFDYGTGQVVDGAQVWEQDLTTGARRRLAVMAHLCDIPPKVSPEGRLILLHVTEERPGSVQLEVMGRDGTGRRQVLNLGPTNAARGEWLDEGRMAFVADDGGRDRVGIVHLDGGVEWLAGEPEVLPFQVIPGRGRFACVTHEASHTRAVVWDGALAPLPNTSGRRSLLPHAALPDGGWLAEAYDADAPHALVRLLPDGACRVLAEAPRDARRAHFAPRDFRWTGPDGRAMQGWLYLPEGMSRGLIVHVHGGPTWHSEDWVNPKIGHLVQAGFTVLDPNYRGSTGFGYAHREAVKQDGWGGREQGDIRAGVEALVAAGLATPGRIGIAGNSYGGFSSWFGITRAPDLFTAAIPMCGMYRLDIDYDATEMPHGRAYSEEMMGGTPDEVPAKYDAASPGRFIHQIRGHVLVVHGLADSNVGPENSHTALRELQAAGIPVEAMLLPDEGHGVARRGNLARYLARAEAFFSAAFDAGPWR